MITAAVRAGAQVSVTVRMDAAVKCAITTIAADAWESIEYTDAVYDEDTGAWISRAEVAEIDFTDFTSRKRSEQVRAAGGAPDPRPQRPRRRARHPLPDLAAPRVLHHRARHHPGHRSRGQDPPRPRGDQAGQRGPQGQCLAHLPSGKFTASAAWLVAATIAYNLSRAGRDPRRRTVHQGPNRHHPDPAGQRSGPDRHLRPQDPPAAAGELAVARSWERLFTTIHGPPAAA